LKNLTKARIAIILLIVLYTAARVWRLDVACLWFDEIFSVHAAEHDWGSLISFVAKDLIHPPLYYLILKGWIAVGGESIFWLRLLSVIFSVLALAPLLLLCKELKLQNSTTLVALFLLCVNGSLINYTQRVRMYTLLMFLSLFSIWLFSRYFYRGKSLVTLAIVNVFLLYAHYYGALIVGCEIATILIFQRIKWRGAAVLSGSGLLFFLPWLYAVVVNARGGADIAQNLAWTSRPGSREIETFIFDLVEPFYFQFSTADPTSIFVVSIPLLITFLTAIVALIVYRDLLKESVKNQAWFLIGFTLVPILIVFAASWILPQSVWGTRHLIICAGPLALLMGLVFTHCPFQWLKVSVISLIVFLSAYAFILQAVRPPTFFLWCAWDRIGNELAAKPETEPNPKVYAFESLIAYHVWFATRNAGNTQVFDVETPETKKVNEMYFLPRGFDGVKKVTPEEITGDPPPHIVAKLLGQLFKLRAGVHEIADAQQVRLEVIAPAPPAPAALRPAVGQTCLLIRGLRLARTLGAPSPIPHEGTTR